MEVFVLVALGVVISVVCSFWCATHALHRGRSPVVWGILGFIIPVIAVIVIAVLPPGDGAE